MSDKRCNRCNKPRTSDSPPLCPECKSAWEQRTGRAAEGLRKSHGGGGMLGIGSGGLGIAATFEQDAINKEFNLGPYAPGGGDGS